jgi:hypothetical protein
MEYCDKGSLRHAMKRGVFHKRLGSTSVAVDLCAIVQVGVCVAPLQQQPALGSYQTHMHSVTPRCCEGVVSLPARQL